MAIDTGRLLHERRLRGTVKEEGMVVLPGGACGGGDVKNERWRSQAGGGALLYSGGKKAA